jgi:outer membrane protein OmpA-like peptidoglycan-associated protein
MTKLKFFIIGLIAFLGASAYGQHKQGPWILGIGAHAVSYFAPTVSGNTSLNEVPKELGIKNWEIVPALSKVDITWRFWDFLAADFRTTMGEIANKHLLKGDNLNSGVDTEKKLYLTAGVGLRAFYLLDFWEPYARLGVAYHRYNYNNTHVKVGNEAVELINHCGHSMLVNGGVGMNFWLGESQKFGLNIEGIYNWNPIVKASGGKNFGGIADHFQLAAGVVFNFGAKESAIDLITDSDGDGIPDALDACPNVRGLKEFNGCPDPYEKKFDNLKEKVGEVKKEVEELKNTQMMPVVSEVLNSENVIVEEDVNLTFEKIHFGFNNAKVEREYMAILKEAAQKINSTTGIFYINGFADRTNQNQVPNVNETVSKRRAEAVKAILIKKGVSKERLVIAGCGVCKDYNPKGNNRFVQISTSKCSK